MKFKIKVKVEGSKNKDGWWKIFDKRRLKTKEDVGRFCKKWIKKYNKKNPDKKIVKIKGKILERNREIHKWEPFTKIRVTLPQEKDSMNAAADYFQCSNCKCVVYKYKDGERMIHWKGFNNADIRSCRPYKAPEKKGNFNYEEYAKMIKSIEKEAAKEKAG